MRVFLDLRVRLRCSVGAAVCVSRGASRNMSASSCGVAKDGDAERMAAESVIGRCSTRHGQANPLRSILAKRNTSFVSSAAALKRAFAALLAGGAM